MPKKSPRVSVGMPVYNGEQFLGEAIESILNQTFEDFELIISDNASTDRTGMMCRDYAARDARIAYHRNATNIGAFRNFNQVFRLAHGEYFKWAAADDLCDHKLLARCVQVLDAEPSVVATYAKAQFIDDTGQHITITDPGWHLMADNPYERLHYVLVSGHWVNVFSGLLRTRVLAGTRLFPDYPGGDCRLIGELSLRGKIFEIGDKLFFRRIHADASSQNTDPDWQSRYFTGNSYRLVMPAWQICLNHCRTIAGSELAIGDKLAALRLIANRMYSSKRLLAHELCGVLQHRFARTPFSN